MNTPFSLRGGADAAAVIGCPLPLTFVFALLLLCCCGSAPAAKAQESSPANTLPPLTAGRVTVAWTPANGLSLLVDGVPVVRKSTLYIVKQGWTGTLLDQTKDRPTVTGWTDASDGAKTGRVSIETENAACIYSFTVSPDDVNVDLAYRLKQDVPAEFEYAAGYLSAPVLHGVSGTATATVGKAGALPFSIPVAPPAPGRTQEQNRLAPSFTALTFDTRLGRISIDFSGDSPPPVVFDARTDSQGWAREFPIFWMGIGSPSLPLTLADGEKRATFRFRVGESPALTPGPSPGATGEGSPGTREAAASPVAHVVSSPPSPAAPGEGGRGGEGTSPIRPDLYTPVLSPAPLVIPRPKQMAPTDRPFRITAATRIVIGDGATVEDKRGAELIRKEIREQFGIDVPIIRARDLVQSRDAIVLGEPGRNTALARLRVAENAPMPPDKPEGYAVTVTPRAALAAGHDAAGTLWGAQTLIQLLAADAQGPMVRGVRITDWPTLSLRAVHLFHGREALPFHKKLIDRVLSRFKMNALFIQAEQVRWDADPQVAPEWAGRKEQVREEIAFARQRGMTVYPLVQSYGHMEWLFNRGRNRDFAEDPDLPYAVNITNPKAVAYLEKFNAEADALFDAPGFHVGLDEVTMRGRFPHRSAPKTFAELFVQNARHWHSFFEKRGKRMWMWADMALHPTDAAPSFGTAPTPEDAAKVRESLPKDIVMVDWQYGAHERFPSLKLLKDAGFADVVAATWYNPVNIRNFSRAAAEVGARGAMQTTWAGYESKEAILSTAERRQFTAMVLAADYFWNGGEGPAPDALPYDAAQVFARQWDDPDPAVAQPRPGFPVDISPLATRPLPDWLGYGAQNGPAQFPSGSETRLSDGTLYRLPTGIALLSGKLNPTDGTPYPASREISVAGTDLSNGAVVGRQVRELRLLVTATHQATRGTKVGTLKVLRDDGKEQVVDLVYGRNIAAWDDPQPLAEGETVWTGKTGAGQPFRLRRLVWRNPEPDVPVRSVTVTSENTEAAPALFALSVLTR